LTRQNEIKFNSINHSIRRIDRNDCEIDRIDRIEWRIDEIDFQIHISHQKLFLSIHQSISKLPTNREHKQMKMGEDEEEEEEEEEEVEKVFSHSYVWYFSFMCVTFPRTPCLNPTRLLITRSSQPQNTVTPHVHFYFRYTICGTTRPHAGT